MTYYATLREDIARAKDILSKGQSEIPEALASLPREYQELRGGTIYGADIYAAYWLLASFVEVIEGIGVDVAETAIRGR